MKELNVAKLKPQAILPVRATKESAGADIHACIDQPVTLKPREIVKIGTGVGIHLKVGTVGLVFGRSGLGVNHGITLANSVGVIDSDYRGEIILGLINQGDTEYTIQPNDRIAQLVVMNVALPNIVEVRELEDSYRGDGGFGSTGR